MVLVCGGAGYIGSVTVWELVDRGHDVVVIDDMSTGHRESLPDSVPFVEGDIGDAELVRTTIRQHQVDSVIHFAAKSLVAESVKDPLLYVTSNVGKTSLFLRVLQEEGVRSIVFSSSAAVYGEPEVTPIPESHAKLPISPYGLSKWWTEETLRWCGQAWGLSWIALRYFNAAGGLPSHSLSERHVPETHLIPRLIAAWSEQKPADIFGTDYPTPDRSAIRDYIHVRDLAAAHILALETTAKGKSGSFNVGTGSGHSVLEVLSALEAETGSAMLRNYLPRRPGDPAALVADTRKIMADLGWRPRLSDLRKIVRSALDSFEAAGSRFAP